MGVGLYNGPAITRDPCPSWSGHALPCWTLYPTTSSAFPQLSQPAAHMSFQVYITFVYALWYFTVLQFPHLNMRSSVATFLSCAMLTPPMSCT